jgi:hypothetical protein
MLGAKAAQRHGYGTVNTEKVFVREEYLAGTTIPKN